LAIVQRQIAESPHSLPALQRLTGVPRATIGRWLRGAGGRELMTLERAFAALGATLAVRSADGRWHHVEPPPQQQAPSRGRRRA
jgi:hypothetical protein